MNQEVKKVSDKGQIRLEMLLITLKYLEFFAVL